MGSGQDSGGRQGARKVGSGNTEERLGNREKLKAKQSVFNHQVLKLEAEPILLESVSFAV